MTQHSRYVIQPTSVLGMLQRAQQLHNLGKLGEAEILYRRVLDVSPCEQQVWQALTDIELRLLHEAALQAATMGEITRSSDMWQGALDIAPEYLGFFMGLLRNNPHDETVHKRLLAVDPDKVPAHLLRTYNWCMFKMRDAQGDYLTAWSHLEHANRLQRAEHRYDEATNLMYLGRIVATCTQSVMGGGFGHQTDRPVFIVGLPRSGTTLIEQILAAHPDVYAFGELRTMGQLANKYRFPEAFQDWEPHIFETIAAEYLQATEPPRRYSIRTTDKMPDNSRFVGLIHMCMPRAKIIWCRRNLMDVTLSYFIEAFSEGHLWSYDLGELARFIVAHERMMAHWRRAGVALFEVHYEKIVENIEAETRRILNYLQLPWDSQCLNYYAIPRAVQTASISQVRKPIYSTSVGRWKHYEAQLASALRIFDQTGINIETGI